MMEDPYYDKTGFNLIYTFSHFICQVAASKGFLLPKFQRDWIFWVVAMAAESKMREITGRQRNI